MYCVGGKGRCARLAGAGVAVEVGVCASVAQEKMLTSTTVRVHRTAGPMNERNAFIVVSTLMILKSLGRNK
jgi:hypothetical protein